MKFLLLLALPAVVLYQLSPETNVQCGTPVVQPITKRIVGGREALDATGDEDVLNQVDIPVLDDGVCSRQFRDFLSDTEICAGYESGIKEFCPNDLGSPLMCKDGNGMWYIQETSVPCGTPIVQPITKRIVGGREAAQGSWPWMVMIVALTNDLHWIIEGSGSILGTHVILTTAQHFEGPGFSVFDLDLRHWRLHLGDHHVNTQDQNQKLYHIRKVIIHPGYNVTSLRDDIALIITQEPIEYNDHTRPACLIDASHHYHVGDICYLPGWGSTLRTGDDEVLNQVDMPILDDGVCSRQFRDFMSDTEICAGYESGIKEFCPSDIGSPLMCKDSNGIWYIQGLASSGVDCHIAKYPGVYEDVSLYSDWIKQTMASSGYPYQY